MSPAEAGMASAFRVAQAAVTFLARRTEAVVASMPPFLWLTPRRQGKRRASGKNEVDLDQFFDLCRNGEKDTLKALLLQARSDPKFDVNKVRTCSDNSIHIGNTIIRTTKIYLQLCPARGQTGLHLAVRGGHLAVVQILLDNRETKLFIQDMEGRTPLDLAAAAGNQDALNKIVASRKFKYVCFFDIVVQGIAALGKDLLSVDLYLY